MQSLDDLLSSAKAAAKTHGTEKPKRSKRYPYAPAKLPNALVLIIHLTHCINCDKEHQSPNTTLLTRFDNLMLNFQGPLSYLKDSNERKRLPREIVVYRSYCAFCQDCFEAETLSDTGIYHDTKWGEDKINPVYLRDDPIFEDRVSEESSENQQEGVDDAETKEETNL